MITFKEAVNNKIPYAKLKRLTTDQQNAIRKAMYNIGKKLLVDAEADIDKQPKHGRTYLVRIGRKGKALKKARQHVASAPLEAPATITGNLRKAHNFLVQGFQQLIFGVEDSVNYGKYLEEGTKHIAPRKWLWRAIQKNQKDAEVIFNQSLKKELEK